MGIEIPSPLQPCRPRYSCSNRLHLALVPSAAMPPNYNRFYRATRCLQRIYCRPSVCLSVCLSQASVSKPLDKSSSFLWRRLPFSSAYSTLCYKEIWVSPKIRVLLHVSFSQIPDLENFAAASRSRCQQNSSSSSSSTVELVDYTYTTVDKSIAILSCLRQSPRTCPLGSGRVRLVEFSYYSVR